MPFVVAEEKLRKVALRALQNRGFPVPPRFMHAKVEVANQVILFTIRVGRARNPLVSLEFLKEEAAAGRLADGSVPGAKYVVFGSVRIAGARMIVHARRVVLETSVVEEAVSQQVDTSERGLLEGINRAFDIFSRPLVC